MKNIRIFEQRKILFIILVIGYFFTGCLTKEPAKSGHEGKPMASFNLLLMDSITKVSTRSIPVGKPTVFLFISPYCPYCQAETEEIVDNIQSLQDIQFYILSDFPFESIKAYANHYGLDKYPNINVAQDYDSYFADYFRVNSIPYIAIYNKNKLLKQVKIGKADVNLIKEIVHE